MEEVTKPNFLTLPDELLVAYIKDLDFQTQLQFRAVDKRLYFVVQEVLKRTRFLGLPVPKDVDPIEWRSRFVAFCKGKFTPYTFTLHLNARRGTIHHGVLGGEWILYVNQKTHKVCLQHPSESKPRKAVPIGKDGELCYVFTSNQSLGCSLWTEGTYQHVDWGPENPVIRRFRITSMRNLQFGHYGPDYTKFHWFKYQPCILTKYSKFQLPTPYIGHLTILDYQKRVLAIGCKSEDNSNWNRCVAKPFTITTY